MKRIASMGIMLGLLAGASGCLDLPIGATDGDLAARGLVETPTPQPVSADTITEANVEEMLTRLESELKRAESEPIPAEPEVIHHHVR